ncbi:MAG TPA: hypothetical protein VH188_01265 [Chthoniobacterales bacterium]|jgi:hypothetical protein|nr:hypothetical protein [Chthoniobacterales bacterium]
MIITNNSEKQTVSYTVSCPGSVDCGHLTPTQETVLPFYDDKAHVKVAFTFAQMKEELSILIDDAAG